MMNRKGFTLIEIIIAIGVLASMVMTMTEVTDGIMLSRKRTEQRTSTRHAVAIAMSRMMDDFRTAFLANKKFAGKDGYFKSGFAGNTNRVDFSSMGNVHYVKNKKDSDQVQVGYSLVGNDRGSFDLVRRQTDYLTDKLDSGGKSFVLLSGITEFSFEYYDSNKEEWEAQWDTDSVSAAGMLPQIVKISFVVQGEAVDEDEEDFKEYAYEIWVPVEMYANQINF